MEEDYQKLLNLFLTEPSKAIEESKKMICSISNFDSYKKFEEFHSQHKIVTNCDENLFSTQLTVLCFNCSTNHSFTVCLSCFLKGNHEGHYYIILPRFYGHCSCGDSSCWKPSGFCSKHTCQHNEHPESYLDANLQKILTDVIFRASITALTELTNDNDQKVLEIIQFIATFLQFGDGFYRLLSIALTEKIDLKELLKNVSNYSFTFNNLLNALCLYCFHDQLFKRYLALATYENLSEKFLTDSIENMISNKKTDNYAVWENFWSQVFTSSQFQYNIEKYNWDWVSLFVKLSNCFKEILGFIGNDKFNSSLLPCFYKTLCSDVSLITEIQPNEPTQNLFDRLFTEVFCTGTTKARKNTNNTNIVASFLPNRDECYYLPVFVFHQFYFKFYQCFKHKPNLKYDVLFDQLDKLINISSIFKIGKNSIGKENENLNDKFIQRFIDKDSRFSPNLFYYNSFHNGASFFVNMPLYDSLVALFRLDNLSRIKIARFLIQPKFQRLRIQLGIITMKKILSFVCYHQGLTPRSNFGLMFIYSQIDRCLRTTHTISRYFSLFQLLIGLESNKKDEEFSLKEFFAFEIAREVGVFDDFNGQEYKDEDVNEQKQKIYFSFFYISLLLVIERTLFNLNGFTYVEEQIVFALKQGVSNIYKIDSAYDIEAFNRSEVFPLADKVISNVSTSNKDDENIDHEIFYYLKDGVEWKTLSAINSINQQKTLLSQEISKNPSKLIKIPDFEPEEEYFFHPKKSFYEREELYENDESEYDTSIDTSDLSIRLKEFVLTPTVLAVVYYSLRNSKENSELNDHLSMNILILASKFVTEQKDSEKGDITSLPSEIHFTSLHDLLIKLQRQIFNYRVDNENNSFVSNTLNKNNFVNLLQIKFSSENMAPKSFIDVLLDKGQLGLNCISQLTVKDDIVIEKRKEEEEDEKVKKKMQAKERKQAILEQFNKVQKNFNAPKESVSNSLNGSSSVNIDSDSCSVCGSTDMTHLSYPIYFYRTKIPFIVDKPHLYDSKDADESLHAVDDDDEDESFQEAANNVDQVGDDDYDYSIPIDQRVKEVAIQSMSSLNMVGNSPEVIRQRQAMIEQIRDQIVFKYTMHEIRVKQKERKNQRQNKSEKSGMKRFTVGANYVVQFGICPHPVHPKCIHGEKFKCPLCKSFKNGFLPYIDSIPKKELFKKEIQNIDECEVNSTTLSEEVVHSITHFIEKFKSFFTNSTLSKSGIFIELIKSISGLIVTYEVRFRSLKRCLEPSKTFDLARNLFLTVWYGYRIEGRPLIIDDETKLTDIQRYVKKLIETDELSENSLHHITSSFIRSIQESPSEVNLKRKEQELLLFLRRVALSDYFLLDSSDYIFDGDHINWEEILSAKNLATKYEVNFQNLKIDEGEDFHFNPLVFCKLPKDFFGFCSKPFNFPVEKIDKATVFNFLNYNQLIQNFDNFEEESEVESEPNSYQKDLLSVDKDKLSTYICFDFGTRICPSVLIYVGGDASKVVVADQSFVSTLKPFYLNLYMTPDIGYARLQPLTLNEKRYERFIDEILSGDFSYYLTEIFK